MPVSDAELRKFLGTESDEVLTEVRAFTKDPCSPKRLLPIVSSCTIFFTAGPCLIMVNKRILVDLKFQFPMLLSSIGLVSCMCITQVLRVFGVLKLEKAVSLETFFKRIFPIGLFQALTLNFGNQSYMYMSVSLLQMLKAMSPVFTLLILWTAGLAKPNYFIVFCTMLITLGTFLSTASSDEINWSSFGFLVVFITELLESVKLALVQYLLGTENGLNFSVMESLTYFAPTTLGWMTIFIAIIELPAFVRSGAAGIVYKNSMLFQSCFILGFLVNVAGFLVIKTTSVVTLKIIVQIRNLALILINVVFWNEVVTPNQWVGYMITVAGFGLYNYVTLKLIRS